MNKNTAKKEPILNDELMRALNGEDTEKLEEFLRDCDFSSEILDREINIMEVVIQGTEHDIYKLPDSLTYSLCSQFQKVILEMKKYALLHGCLFKNDDIFPPKPIRIPEKKKIEAIRVA
jgi:hypothetical protein